MPKSDNAVSWVVYTTDPLGKTPGVNVVCEQREWDQLELTQPGQHGLVRAGITSEAEAEILARGTSGDPKPRTPRRS
jgi:hypothetical protein